MTPAEKDQLIYDDYDYDCDDDIIIIRMIAHRWLVEDEYNLKKFDRWTVR